MPTLAFIQTLAVCLPAMVKGAVTVAENSAHSEGGAAGTSDEKLSVSIHNGFMTAPAGIACVVNDQAAFVVDVGRPWDSKVRFLDNGWSIHGGRPGMAAPDHSIYRATLSSPEAVIIWTWGRVGNAAVGLLTTDRPTTVTLKLLKTTWPGFVSEYSPTNDGAMGRTTLNDGTRVKWQMAVAPTPTSNNGENLVVPVTPTAPVRLVAGLGALPAFSQVDSILDRAEKTYSARRPAAAGTWGDFVGAISDNLNNTRIFSADNHRFAHSVSRMWGSHANSAPYFCWDSFFNGALACLDDPEGAKATVRAILSCATADKFIPNYAHTHSGVSEDRSQPPVGAMCVWKMHQRSPDLAFLKEVYPSLAAWHAWWPTARDGNKDGLLEWGSNGQGWQGALYETGWDDTLHFEGAAMSGSTMNANAVDLNSLWSLDAEYLALIAKALGKNDDAATFTAQHQKMNQLINDRLWNESLGMYCSRLWEPTRMEKPLADSTGFTHGGQAGLRAEYFRGIAFQTSVLTRTDSKIDFNWDANAPAPEVPRENFSVRWTAVFTPPVTATYTFAANADDGVRVLIDGKPLLEDWSIGMARESKGNITLNAGQPYDFTMEYYQASGGASARLKVSYVDPAAPPVDFLTRWTPMNFYPMMCGAPDAQRAQRMIKMLTDPSKFWGGFLLPTLAYDDPMYPVQNYWRGKTWAPANYLVFQGVKRYAPPEVVQEFAKRSVGMFMTHWKSKGICSENYLSTDGSPSSDPNYTWGSLMCLIGVESTVDILNDGTIKPAQGVTDERVLHNIPLGGANYRIEAKSGTVTVKPEPRR